MELCVRLWYNIRESSKCRLTNWLLADRFVRRHRHRAQARDRENTECSRGLHGLPPKWYNISVE